ncbi:MAG: RluA family pseudouridine synthase [Planctomycetota bacterium]|jgi:23S rRNA pseudouridine1911/1915/1917 synthase
MPSVNDGKSNSSDDRDGLIARGGKVDRETLYALYEQQADDDETPISATFRLARDLNKRLDRYLVDRIPFLSRTSLQRLIKEEAVTVNGRVGKPATRLRAGDEVVAVLPPPPSAEIPAEEIPLDVLYEDAELIIINKADDIIVHPARGNRSGTMINALAWHFQHETGGALSTVGEKFARPGVVHRLDRHTTGALAFAKTDTAHWRLAHQFEHRRVDKRYLAVVHGRMETLADVIDVPLGKHPTAREKYAVRWDDTGKPSVTIYRVRELYDEFSLLELELKTGRTHQIRVHLSHLGYPIVGDDMYGGRHLTVGGVAGAAGTGDRSPREPLIGRQALHAAVLGFTHPIAGEPMSFQVPPPDDMRDLIMLLRTHQHREAPPVAGATIDLDDLLPSGA